MKCLSAIFMFALLSFKLASAQNKPVSVAPITPPPVESTATETATIEELPLPEESQEKPVNLLQGIIEEYDYKPGEKRDPFAPFFTDSIVTTSSEQVLGPVTPLERFDLDQLKLVGIIWNVPKPKALVMDPDQSSYVVGNNTRLGRNSGYIAEIREGEIVVVETFVVEGKAVYRPRVLKLQKE